MEKKFDKEYPCTYPLEYLYLKECGIPYVYIKTINGITTWKYAKNETLFNALADFYKNRK